VVKGGREAYIIAYSLRNDAIAANKKADAN
jgi:hypothetical protein